MDNMTRGYTLIEKERERDITAGLYWAALYLETGDEEKGKWCCMRLS